MNIEMWVIMTNKNTNRNRCIMYIKMKMERDIIIDMISCTFLKGESLLNSSLQ